MARTTLERFAADVAAGMEEKPRDLTYTDLCLLDEIEAARGAGEIAALRRLDRLREVAGLPQDPRVRELLQARGIAA
jgi:hypothetical protein